MHRVALSWRTVVASCALAAGVASPALATPVVESFDHVEINWATHKIHYIGEAMVEGDKGDSLKAAERRAWVNGLEVASETVRGLNAAAQDGAQAPDKAAEHATDVARSVAASTTSYNTVYFGDGRVRVLLENQLPKALLPSGTKFRQKASIQTHKTQYSGIVLKLDRPMKPRGMYKVVDESGAVLYSVQDMAEESYRKNLMGRWYQAPQPDEIAPFVGKSPVTIPVAVAETGKLQVARADWDKALEGHRALLVNGTIVVAVP